MRKIPTEVRAESSTFSFITVSAADVYWTAACGGVRPDLPQCDIDDDVGRQLMYTMAGRPADPLPVISPLYFKM